MYKTTCMVTQILSTHLPLIYNEYCKLLMALNALINIKYKNRIKHDNRAYARQIFVSKKEAMNSIEFIPLQLYHGIKRDHTDMPK